MAVRETKSFWWEKPLDQKKTLERRGSLLSVPSCFSSIPIPSANGYQIKTVTQFFNIVTLDLKRNYGTSDYKKFDQAGCSSYIELDVPLTRRRCALMHNIQHQYLEFLPLLLHMTIYRHLQKKCLYWLLCFHYSNMLHLLPPIQQQREREYNKDFMLASSMWK